MILHPLFRILAPALKATLHYDFPRAKSSFHDLRILLCIRPPPLHDGIISFTLLSIICGPRTMFHT